jgi:hypothetical protein
MATPAVQDKEETFTVPMLTKRQRLELVRSQLETERASFISHWRLLNDFILPRRGRFTPTDGNKGDRRSSKIIDSAATFAARTLQSGMMSGITSPARPWKRLTTPDPDLAEFASVKAWLHTVNQRMDTVFSRSNLYNVLPSVYGDMGVFGTAAFGVFEDDEDVIRCYPYAIGSYCLANDHKLRVRTFTREFRRTARQLAEQFGVDRLSTATKAKLKQGTGEAWVDVVHVVQPNAEYNPSRLDSRFKKFYGCYYEKGAASGDPETLLEERGFDEFPILAPRWALSAEDVYATDSPGMTALGDIMQLQTMKKRGLQAIEKKVNPPMVGPPELMSVKASILPGDITYSQETQGTRGFRAAHEVNLDLSHLNDETGEIRALIRRAFYEDLFLMLAYQDDQRGAQPPTAAEIAVRQQEKLLAIGPVLEQFNQDVLDPLVERTFSIMLRQGYIPEPPRELEGVPLKVEYISIMAQAQKQVGLAGLERFAGFVGSLIKTTGNPAILDKIDVDQMVDEYGDATGVNPKVIIPDDQVAKIREARAKQQAAQQAVQVAAEGAKAAQSLSKSDTSGKNALTDLLSSGDQAA